jgi:ubiquinone/menaquinone biosynthesis C-methylase UbiE
VFSKTARYYDLLYSFKDYKGEAEQLWSVIRAHLGAEARRLLDVACGTGAHIEQLKAHLDVVGVDLDAQLLEIARQRNPTVPFYCADMTDLNLGQVFDVVTCLFSSIGYVRTIERLDMAIHCMARHVRPGGLLIVEPWFTPQEWHPHTVHAMLYEQDELKIARVNTSFVKGRLSYFDLHYLIGTPEGTEHLVERHELGLFEVDEMCAAYAKAGLDVTYDPQGLIGRGLYVGRRPTPAG